jgi:hypothetical protein
MPPSPRRAAAGGLRDSPMQLSASMRNMRSLLDDLDRWDRGGSSAGGHH